jgi:hypothetical protein
VQGTKGEPHGAAETIRTEFGGCFQLLCAHCFRCSPPSICPIDPQGQCPKHGACPSLLIHVSTEGRKQQYVEVRPQPQNRKQLNYCMFVERGQPCRHGASRCQYAHSAVEMAVWGAERLGGLQRGDLLAPPALREDKCTAACDQPSGVLLYCHACLVTCRSPEAFENHCFSLDRVPPMGLSKFELCPR